MALRDYLIKNGLGGLANSVGAPLIFKLSEDETVLHAWASIKDTETDGEFEIEFTDPAIIGNEVITKPAGAVDVTKNFAFVSFNTVYDTDTSKYTYTNKTINFVDTDLYYWAQAEVTDVLLIADAQAQGIDVSGATGPTITVTRNKKGWKVVSCVKEVIKHEIVYDGSKAVTIDLF